MPLYKKILIGVSILVMILLLADFGLNFWIDKQLPKIISKKNDSPHYITYKDLEVDLWSGNIKVTGIIILPKATLKDSVNKAGVYSEIESIEVEKIKIWNLVFNDTIKAKSITINKPHVLLYKKNEKPIDNSKNIRNPFQKIIVVSDIYLNKGDMKIVYVKNNKPILSIENITVRMEGIVITDEILKNKIPFSYRKYNLSCDSIYYRANEFYYIKATTLQTKNTGLSIKKLAILPEYTRRQFVKKLTVEKDLYTVHTDSIRIKNMDWGFKNDQFFFNAGAVIIDRLSANIYRDLTPADNLNKSFFYNKQLRDIPFPLKLNTILIRNSTIVYEEEKDYQKGPAILTLSKFNLNTTPIQSGFGQKKLPDLKIKINCRFMDASPLHVDWALNVLDKTDGFNIRGSVFNIDAATVSPYAKPYLNATFKGFFDELYFNFTGNDRISKGDVAIKYHDLKVTLYKKKDFEKKSKLKSAIANLLLKNDSNNKTKNANVELKRIPEKSFYNLLWRSIAEGLKKILI